MLTGVMLGRLDIHNRSRRLKLAIKGVKESEVISKKNKKLMLDLADFLNKLGATGIATIFIEARLTKEIKEKLEE